MLNRFTFCGNGAMRANPNMLGGSTGRESLLFSTLFVGAILAITSVLCAVDMATVRALLSVP